MLGKLRNSERPPRDLIDMCQQLRPAAATSVTEAAWFEASLLGDPDPSAPPLTPVALADLVRIAENAAKDAEQDKSCVGEVFVGYPAYVAAVALERQSANLRDYHRMASLLETAEVDVSASRESTAGTSPS